MEITANALAKLINGTLEGDPDVTVSRPAPIEIAGPGDFSFLDNPKYESYAYSTKASILLVHDSFVPNLPVEPTLIRVENVRYALALLLQQFDTAQHRNGVTISEKAYISKNAKIGVGTTVGAFAVIEDGAEVGNDCIIYPQTYIGRNARIGNDCRLYPGVRVHYNCTVGDRCILHANAVIGADGFGYNPGPDHSWLKVPQVGKVVIEDDVEVGACTCIDRAALGNTVIHAGAKLDNLIHIAHGVEVGRNTAIAAQVGVAGSAHLGENVQIGGQAGIVGHVRIADGTRIQAQSGVASAVEKPNSLLFGSPAIGYKDYIRSYAVFKQLPELYKKLHDLENRLKAAGLV